MKKEEEKEMKRKEKEEEKELMLKLLDLLREKKIDYVSFPLDVNTEEGMEEYMSFYKKFPDLYFGANTGEKLVMVTNEKKNL